MYIPTPRGKSSPARWLRYSTSRSVLIFVVTNSLNSSLADVLRSVKIRCPDTKLEHGKVIEVGGQEFQIKLPLYDSLAPLKTTELPTE